MNYEDYFVECWNSISDTVVSDEYYARNETLMNSITEDFYYIHDKSGRFPPEVAKSVIIAIFSNISNIGVR